ncbi:MAG: hypothetical protein LBF80_06990 [Spirochaetaceae bacterium]|jgi:hypothetical protein|nr:hypothetical protein [Spirochaetaceae bacterium]
MAKEIKSINVSPSNEEATINVWQSFGWQFKSTQEVKTQDVQIFTGQDSDGTEHYQTTKGEHYVKVTFERDPAMPNYARLVELEETYNISPPVSPDLPSEFGCLWMVLALIGLVFFVVPGILIIVWRITRSAKSKKVYEEEFLAYTEKKKLWEQTREKAINEAKTLC